MIYYVYILQSKSSSRSITYTGYTNNLKKRLLLHNCGKGAKFTRGRFWEIIYKKKFFSKSSAMKFESLIKKKRYIKHKLIKNLSL
jgi:putative endonuclease